MEHPLTTPVAGQSAQIACQVEGTSLRLLEQGRERFEAILRLIDQAQTSVRLLFYIFSNDAAGVRVRDALLAAARRGVKVKLLIDGFGCSDLGPDFFAGLEAAGGDHCLFHPRYGRRYLLRNHQKLVIADDRRAIIGGANVERHYFEDSGPLHWRDLWLSLEGPAVRHAARYFDSLYRWTISPRPRIRRLRRLISHYSQSSGALQWKFSGPMQRRNPWPAALAREISGGSRLDVISAYFSPPGPMLRRIGRLARRGRARIITAALSDNNVTVAAARHTYRRLLRRGVEMFEFRAARLHSKLLIIDDVVHLGSANLDFRSLYLNLEIMLRIDDPRFAQAVRDYFERQLAECERITLETHLERSSLLRRLQWAVAHWLVTTMDYTVTRRLNFRTDV